jgi:DNA-binding response OmpR family regulator/AraC-like DNA-binding protein
VLFVDDDAAVVDSLGRLLTASGFQVDSAGDGETGMVLARSGAHGVILLDLRLPGMSGLEVLRQLRREGIWTPVLILTGFASIDSAFEAGSVGAVRYLAKPIGGTELVAALRAATAEPQRPRGPRLFSPHGSERADCISALLRQLDIHKGPAEPAPADSNSADLVRVLTEVAANRAVTFLEFVALANATRLLSSPGGPPLSVAIPRIREAIEAASGRGPSPSDSRVEQVLMRLETSSRAGSPRAGGSLAADMKLDRVTLWRLLQNQIGLTFPQCRRAVVMRRAVLELAGGDEHVRQIAFSLGYEDAANFGRDFHQFFGVTPTGFRRLQRPNAKPATN